MSVTSRLSEFIELNNIKQKDLASLFGIKPGSISGIFSGKSEITTAQLITLANTYRQLDLRWLLTGDRVLQKHVITEEKLNIVNEPCINCAVLQKKINQLNSDLIESQKETIAALQGETKIPKANCG